VSKLTALIRNHRSIALIGGGVLVLGAGIGAGIGLSNLGSSGPSAASAVSTTTTTTAPMGATGRHGGAHKGVRGQITNENGSTWTVLTELGKTVTVDITPSTQFGTLASPGTESSFPVGSEIAATGARSAGVVTATRIFTPLHPAGWTGTGGSTPTTAAG
jgi:F0F1-type ATP synthase membrane subunit c/vacuolar-type H+-ATPase subunit K